MNNAISCYTGGNNRHFALVINPWFVDEHQMLDLYSLEVRIEEEKHVAVGDCKQNAIKLFNLAKFLNIFRL